MPLMTAVCTAVDQTLSNSQIIDKCMQFLFNDTTCYFADEEDRVLFARQKKHWLTLHHYIHTISGAPQHARPALARGDAEAGFGKLPHPEELVSFCTNYVTLLDIWHLTALNTIATETKSLLIAIAALHGDFHVMHDINNVVDAGRVEEEFQIENWGLVEGGHDYDRLNASISIGAARTMLDMVKK
jgi:ATP synthase F1 complex assembly factor 2